MDKIETLQDELNYLDAECVKIKQALTMYGKADREWYAKAQAALSIKNRERQKLFREISAAKKEAKKINADRFQEHLLAAVRAHVGEATFTLIWNDAHQRFQSAIAVNEV